MPVIARRMSLILNEEEREHLKQMAESANTSKTEIIKRALFQYDYCSKAMRKGSRLFVVHPDGSQVEVVMR